MLAALLWLIALAQPAGAAVRCADLRPGTAEVALVSGAKPVLLHVPPAGVGAAPMPLVLLLHGSTASGKEMLVQSGLAATADAETFLLAAPDGGIAAGRGFVWNIPGVPTVTGAIPGPDARDDVAYLLGTVNALVAAGCVDPARVYVTGLSGGGRMTSWLGCVAADRFAGIAPVVGLRAGNPLPGDPERPDPASCRPSRPVPVIAFAGDADRTNPIAGGGAGYWRYTMHVAEQRWAALNGCRGPEATRWVARDIYEERYAGCREGAEVVGRITVGGTHRWLADNGAMWRFFAAHPRR